VTRAIITLTAVIAAALAACGTTDPGIASAPTTPPPTIQRTPETRSVTVTPVLKPTVQQTPDSSIVAEPAVTGPTAQEVVDAFIEAGLRAPKPRDNSRNCTGDGGLGCLQLITTDAISVYSWPTEASAQNYLAAAGDDLHGKGLIVLSYAAARTPKADRPKYEAVLNKLISS
jgi:hypothetical protein